MRVVGYFLNSHFFNLIQKYVIDNWNSTIESKRGKEGLYVLKDISFINRRAVYKRVEDQVQFFGNSSVNQLAEIGKDVKQERAKISVNKKNYVDQRVNEHKRVDETFGFDGWVMVNALFSPLETELKYYKKSQNKAKWSVVGSVILEKVDRDDMMNKSKLNKIQDDLLNVKFAYKNPSHLGYEKNPFNHKTAFKFNPDKVSHRKSSFPLEAGDASTKNSKKANKIPVRYDLTKNLENPRECSIST